MARAAARGTLTVVDEDVEEEDVGRNVTVSAESSGKNDEYAFAEE